MALAEALSGVANLSPASADADPTVDQTGPPPNAKPASTMPTSGLGWVGAGS